MPLKKKVVKKSEVKPKEAPKPVALNPSEAKLKELAELEHVEDFFHIFTLLNDKASDKFVSHIKAGKQNKKSKITTIIQNSKSKAEITEKLQEEILTHLQDKNDELKDNISSLRKDGYDMYIESVKIMSVPLKLKMYKATRDKKDFFRIKKILDDIEKSVTEQLNIQKAREAQEEAARKEKEQAAKKAKALKEQQEKPVEKKPAAPAKVQAPKTPPTTKPLPKSTKKLVPKKAVLKKTIKK